MDGTSSFSARKIEMDSMHLEIIRHEIRTSEKILEYTYKQDCERDFEKFCRIYLSHLFNVEMCSMHREIMQLLSNKETDKRLVILAARGHGKTTIIVSFMLWLLCYKHAEYILFIGANLDIAVDRIEKVLDEIENNDAVRRDFDHLAPMMDIQGKFRKYQKKGRVFSSRQVLQARGYKAGIRGELILGKRPDTIFVDDPEKEDVIESPTLREKLRRIFYASVEHLGSAYEETNIIVTDTMKHFDSLASNLEKREDWVSVKYPAHKLDGSKEVAWSKVFCFHVDDLEPWEIEHWDKKGSKRREWRYVEVEGVQRPTKDIRQPYYGHIEREVGKHIIGLGEGEAEKSEIFEQEFLLIPLRLHEMPLRVDDWKFFTVTRELLNSLDDIIFMLDLSLGTTAGDYQAGVVMGRRGRYYYVIQAFLERIPLVLRRGDDGRIARDENRMTLSKLVAAYCKKYDVTSIHVEDNSMQQIYLQTLMDDIEDLYNNDTGWIEWCRDRKLNPVMMTPDIYGHTSKGNKDERIMLHLGILVSKGFVYFRQDWRDKYRTFGMCVSDYPQAKNDDAPDVLDMAIRVLEERRE